MLKVFFSSIFGAFDLHTFKNLSASKVSLFSKQLVNFLITSFAIFFRLRDEV